MLLARSGWRLPLLLAAVALSTGCVRETTEGTAHVFQNELWVPIVTFLGGVAAAVGGWFVKAHSDRFGWTMIILGPIAALGLAPALFLDRVAIDDSGMSAKVGIWVFSAPLEVKYDNLAQVRLIKEETTGRRGRKNVNYSMLCEKKSGGEPTKVPLGNHVIEAAAPAFLEAVQQRGIPIINETGE
ncbi:hypothetical protein [Lacipirellula parvula]|uniref:Lipoprotein n=1 Tax=Lacipirellula parvula TaxID=2650471 RepID=A0A5K7XK72_9BACT|nr:hypothetical protein [Lacipirellula parvula]BBO36572.1 hypothetical protein PLANPX_6184 [Lacipirellula parvula]